MHRIFSRVGSAILCWGLIAARLCADDAALSAANSDAVPARTHFVVWSQPQKHFENPVLGAFLIGFQAALPNNAPPLLKQGLPKLEAIQSSYTLGRVSYFEHELLLSTRVMRFRDPGTAKTILDHLKRESEAKTVPELKFPLYAREPLQFDNKDKPDWKLGSAAALLDEQTVIQSDTVEQLLNLVAARQAAATNTPWAKDLAAFRNEQTAVLINLAELRKEYSKYNFELGRGLFWKTIQPLWEKAEYSLIGINTTDGIAIRALAHSENEAAAKEFKATLEGLIGMGRSLLPFVKQSLAAEKYPQEVTDQLQLELEELFKSIMLEQTGQETKLTLKLNLSALALIPQLMLPQIQKARLAGQEAMTSNNLRNLTYAALMYQQQFKTFPASALLKTPDSKYPYSWRVALLPYMEEQQLYAEYRFDEPWDSEHNKKLIEKMPDMYRSPFVKNKGCTSYVALVHEQGIFNTQTAQQRGIAMNTIKDGLSQTILFVEAPTEIPWTQPSDLEIADGKPLPNLMIPACNKIFVALADGGVLRFSSGLPEEALRAMIFRNDGKDVDPRKLAD